MPATTLHTPKRKMASKTRPASAKHQLMNTADEYRFVTGGRPEMYIRPTMAAEWTQNARNTNQKAARFSDRLQPNQAPAASTNAVQYRATQNVKAPKEFM